MAENSGIEWCKHTWSPWRGCTKVSDGCKHCYADTQSKRNPGTLGVWGPHGSRVVAAESYWRQPLKWDREAAEAGERRRVFCASMADVFEDWQGPMVLSSGEIAGRYKRDVAYGEWVPDDQCEQVSMGDVRRRLFALIDATPNLDWLLLTKRPENIGRMIADVAPRYPIMSRFDQAHRRPNLWLGTSVENQAAADERIPHLLRVPAAVRFLSCEPLLSGVNLQRSCSSSCPNKGHCVRDLSTGHRIIQDSTEGGIWVECACSRLAGIDWVIVGGESGPKARPCDVAWIRSIRDQCKAAGVACFVKQLGANHLGIHGERVWLEDSKGGDWSEWPNDLRVREFPDVE